MDYSRLKVVYSFLCDHCCGEGSGGGLVEEEGLVELRCASCVSGGCENAASNSGCKGHIAGYKTGILSDGLREVTKWGGQ